MSQMLLDFSAKSVHDPPRPLDSEGYLRRLVDSKEPLIYLYGQNPHMCFIRSHSSDDDGTDFPIMRKDAETIIHNWYDWHCNHVSHNKRRARVYLRRGKKRKSSTENS